MGRKLQLELAGRPSEPIFGQKQAEAAGRNEWLELCSDGAQAHQRDALLRRILHQPAGAQPHRRVSIPNSPPIVIFISFLKVWLK